MNKSNYKKIISFDNLEDFKKLELNNLSSKEKNKIFRFCINKSAYKIFEFIIDIWCQDLFFVTDMSEDIKFLKIIISNKKFFDLNFYSLSFYFLSTINFKENKKVFFNESLSLIFNNFEDINLNLYQKYKLLSFCLHYQNEEIFKLYVTKLNLKEDLVKYIKENEYFNDILTIACLNNNPLYIDYLNKEFKIPLKISENLLKTIIKLDKAESFNFLSLQDNSFSEMITLDILAFTYNFNEKIFLQAFKVYYLKENKNINEIFTNEWIDKKISINKKLKFKENLKLLKIVDF